MSNRSSRLVATSSVVGLCVLAFAVTLLRAETSVLGQLTSGFEAPLLVELGALSLPEVWEAGEWWRVASAVFLHGSALHLGLNMMALWSVGGLLERAVGPWRWGVVFALSGIGGCLASLVWVDGWLVVGASGAIFGVAGAVWVLRLKGDREQRGRLSQVRARALGVGLAGWLVFGAVVSTLGWLPLAQGGHVGGLLVGLGCGLILSRGVGMRLRVLTGLGLGGVLVASSVGARGEWRPSERSLALGYAFLATGRPAAAVPHLEAARSVDIESPGLANDLAYALALADEQLPRAAMLAAEALAAEPSNVDYLDTAGWVACLRGDVAAGLASLERALEIGAAGEGGIVREHLATCTTAARLGTE